MDKRMRSVFSWCLVGCFLFFFIQVSGASPDPPYRIFILHSYESGHVCGQPQHDGVVSALEKAGMKAPESLTIETYFMDTKKKNNTEALIREQSRIALGKIRSFRPDVLVILDDNAFRTVGLALADTPVPIVFCGMNGQPEAYHRKKAFMESRERPGHNITGVYEKLHFVDAIRVHTRLFPKTRKVVILSDLSPTGRAILTQIRLEIACEPLPCAHEIRVVKNWEGYQQQILNANQDPEVGVIYPGALLVKDRTGRTYTAPEIFAWTRQNSTKPEIAINYAFTKMGLFGGVAVDFHAMGEQAGQMVVGILQGEDPGGIPVEEAQRYALVFNLDRARQLGIQIPPDVLLAADDVIMAKGKTGTRGR
jgi:putative tryptophan/tyrosine transport system substrate-binding protein